MRHLVLLVMLLATCGGCNSSSPLAQTSDHPRAPGGAPTADRYYDNGGGFAYGGLWIALYATGTFDQQVYTDVFPNTNPVVHGTYQQTGDTCVLTFADGQQVTYHVVATHRVEYLLNDDQFAAFVRKGGHEFGATLHRKIVRAGAGNTR